MDIIRPQHKSSLKGAFVLLWITAIDKSARLRLLKRERDILHIPRDVDMLRTAFFTGPARDTFGSLAMPSLMEVGIIHFLQYRVIELLQLVVYRKIPRDRDVLGAIVHAI